MRQLEQYQHLLSQQQANDECFPIPPDQNSLKEFDVSTYGELAGGYIIVCVCLIAIIFQLRLLKQTYNCLRNTNRNIYYLLLVQSASLLTILVELSSFLLITSFFFEVNDNPLNYTEDTYSSSNILGITKAYNFLQQLGVAFYILTFYLALKKWLEILKITMKMNNGWFRVAQVMTHSIFSAAFILLIIDTVFLLSNSYANIDQYLVSAAIITTGVFTSLFVWHLNSKIELIYEIDYQFKRKLWVIIISSPIRCAFDILQTTMTSLKCFSFQGDQGSLQNIKPAWAYLLPITVIINNCAVIPFSMLFSPSKKFRQNNKDQYSSLTEDG